MAVVVTVVHGHAFMHGLKMGMIARVIMTSAIFQKVCGCENNKKYDLFCCAKGDSLESGDYRKAFYWSHCQPRF